MSREQGGKGKINVEASLNKKDVQRNSIFEKYSESEMIAQLKGLALDPCSPQFAWDNIRPLYNQILELRKVMVLNDSEIPWRKRKLEQLVKDKLRAPSSFTIHDQQNISKLNRSKLSHSSSVSCLVNFSESTKLPADKTLFYSHSSNSLSTFDDPLPENCQDKDMVIDSDESVIGSNPPTPHNLNSPTFHEPNKKKLNRPRKSNRLSNFIGDYLQKCVIPVGPRFQAVVPELSNTFDRNTLIDQYKKNSDNSKWLGTQIWPIETMNATNIEKPIGKGRTDICRCMTPGSVECVKRHCLEARIFLRCDLGPTFISWKFDEMGEQIAKLWTLKEQQCFESLVKMRPSSNGKNFLKHALKSIPEKSRKEIVNYYFNVYIPRRMSVLTRSSSIKVVDSDVEDEPKGSEGEVVTTSKSKKVKDQYLRAYS